MLDVTDEDAVIAGFADAAVEFGGLDILVSNAGIASSAPIEETDARDVEHATWTSWPRAISWCRARRSA